MDIIITVLNRTFYLLKKVNNLSPLIGSVILLTLIISFNIYNIKLLIFAFLKEPTFSSGFEYFFVLIIFYLLLNFAKRNKKKIILPNIEKKSLKNIITIVIYLLTLTLTIVLANINRSKIMKNNKSSSSVKSEKKSIESEIRNFFK